MDVPLILAVTVEPTTRGDGERLGQTLQRLAVADPAVRVDTDQTTGLTRIAGTSELHLETIVDRLKREFNVGLSIRDVQVIYKETLTRPADGEMKYATQTGGRRQYGHVKIHLFPGEPDTGYIFENETTGGSIPKEFIKPIDEGIKEALTRGILAGYPIDDVRIELYDGSYHDVDSSEMAFKIAGSMAFQDAAKKAKPVLLQPIIWVEVAANSEDIREVIAGIERRHGQIESTTGRDGLEVVSALAPLSAMLGYAYDVRARTSGRARQTRTRFARYERIEGLPGSDGDTVDAPVMAPRSPTPREKHSGIALPEPDDEDERES